MSDVDSSAKCRGDSEVSWHAIAVIEELGLHDNSLEMGTPADHVSTTDRWGACYFIDQHDD